MQFLSEKGTKSIKGILASMVLISHIHGRIDLFDHSVLGTIFSAFGYLAVSTFFFLSAIGLHERYMQSGKTYITGFFSKKILPYYVMCCVVILIYLIRDLLKDGTTQWVVLLQSFFIGKTVVDMGWYLQAQLLLYVIFWIGFACFSKGRIWCIIAMLIAYCVVCSVAGLSTTWYEGILCFPLGLVCAKYKHKIVSFLKKPIRMIASAIGLMVVFLVTLWFGNRQILPEGFRICVKMLSTFSFNGLVIITASCISINNPITMFLGKYSFEIYVLQGLLLNGLRPVIQNDWVYIFVAAAGVIMLSLAAHPLFGIVCQLATVKVKRENG